MMEMRRESGDPPVLAQGQKRKQGNSPMQAPAPLRPNFSDVAEPSFAKFAVPVGSGGHIASADSMTHLKRRRALKISSFGSTTTQDNCSMESGAERVAITAGSVLPAASQPAAPLRSSSHHLFHHVPTADGGVEEWPEDADADADAAAESEIQSDIEADDLGCDETLDLGRPVSHFVADTFEEEKMMETPDAPVAVSRGALRQSASVALEVQSEYTEMSEHNREWDGLGASVPAHQQYRIVMPFTSELCDSLVHLFQKERSFPILPDYMRRQPQLKCWMREHVINWLCDLGGRMNVDDNTVATSIVNFDRFLAVSPCRQSGLQLIALTSFQIACKMFERAVPRVSTLVQLTRSLYKEDDFKQMELIMLKRLGWRTRVVTPHAVVSELFHAFPVAHRDQHLLRYAMYLADLLLSEYSLMQYPYSVLGFGACLGAFQRHDLSSTVWERAVQSVCKFHMGAVRHAQQRALQLVREANRPRRVQVAEEFDSYPREHRNSATPPATTTVGPRMQTARAAHVIARSSTSAALRAATGPVTTSQGRLSFTITASVSRPT